MSDVTVFELQRAWRAIQAGQFSDPTDIQQPEWTPNERVLPVLGVQGQCGASTVALALATESAPARVVECASGPACGLIGAPTRELGPCGDGWTRGLRGEVVVEHSHEIRLGAAEVPLPASLDGPVGTTIVDVGWDPSHVLSITSWLSSLLSTSRFVVLVATVSVPSLRRLENTLAVMPTTATVVAAVVGPPLKRWPKPVMGSTGTLTHHLINANRLVTIPTIDSLRLAGVTPEPLPQPVLSAAAEVVRIVDQLLPTPTEAEKDV